MTPHCSSIAMLHGVWLKRQRQSLKEVLEVEQPQAQEEYQQLVLLIRSMQPTHLVRDLARITQSSMHQVRKLMWVNSP
jgi:hypothetical protein